MQSITVALIFAGCVFGGGLFGLGVGSRLPSHHVDRRTQDLVKLGMGTIATLMALVLGLMVATAKASFDTTEAQTNEFAAKALQLDRVLERYGAAAEPARRLLQRFFAVKIAELWPEQAHDPAPLPSRASDLLDAVGDHILALSPRSDAQKTLLTRAQQLAGDLGQTRWLIIEHATGSSIPAPLLVVLLFWATILFVSFGLFAPRHATAIAVLFLGALSIGAAIFIVLEMSHPFSGVMRIPSAPARNALANMR
jgi:hypothetical protein